MKKISKLLAAVFVLVAVMLTLTGCGGNKNNMKADVTNYDQNQ